MRRYVVAGLAALGAVAALTLDLTSAQFAVANAPALTFPGEIVRDVPVGGPGNLALDYYVPEAAGPHPVIVFFHGGSWQSGTKDLYRFVGMTLAEAGYMVVIPDYRKYPAVKFPAFVEDGARALAWAAANVDRLGGDADRIYVAGHSAGAQLGAMLAVDERFLEEVGAAGIIAGFAGLAGPYHFTPQAEDMRDIIGPPERYKAMPAGNIVDGS